LDGLDHVYHRLLLGLHGHGAVINLYSFSLGVARVSVGIRSTVSAAMTTQNGIYIEVRELYHTQRVSSAAATAFWLLLRFVFACSHQGHHHFVD
jgi:hypothetical protein